MSPDEVAVAQSDTIAIKVLKFISSIGHYGMILAPIQAAYGIYQWDKIPFLVGVFGGVFCFGWKMFWDWIITKAIARPKGAR